MTSNRLTRFVSLLLVFALLVNMFPIHIFASQNTDTVISVTEAPEEETNDPDSGEAPTQPRIVEEITENRTEFTKEFKMSNGLHMATVYANAVHFEKDGQWEEIDNTLQPAETAEGNAYTNTSASWQVQFPQTLTSENPITITRDGHTLSFSMADSYGCLPPAAVS